MIASASPILLHDLRRRFRRGLAAVLVLVCAMVTVPAISATGAQEKTVDLIVVNGEPITVADLDAMIMTAHGSMDMEQQGTSLVQKLLKKAVNDRLLIQDAYASAMDADDEIVELVASKRSEYAAKAYLRDRLELPSAATPDSIRAYFERYYWRIQVRRISVRTRAEASTLRDQIIAGASMDSLARAVSLDTKKLTGGLYKLLYWADVENRIRDQVRTLSVGEYSEVFPYNEAFSFVRVEQRLPVHEEAFAEIEPSITPKVLFSEREMSYRAFLDELAASVRVREDIGGLMAIVADSASVLTGDFLKQQPEPVITIEGGSGVTGSALRRSISHEAMQNAHLPFADHVAKARRDETDKLVIGHAARSEGYFDDPAIEERVTRDLEERLIEMYLTDHIASKIRFNREEFQEVYEENLPNYRGPDEVRLDILILDDRAQAEEAAQRLKTGADFGYIFKQYHPAQDVAPGKANFIKITELSQPFRDQLAHLEVGQSSDVVDMPMGFMVFHLDARRPGTAPPLESVEMDIRRVIYQREFNKLLDAHLAVLKEASEIEYHDDRIEAYVRSEEEGQ